MAEQQRHEVEAKPIDLESEYGRSPWTFESVSSRQRSGRTAG